MSTFLEVLAMGLYPLLTVCVFFCVALLDEIYWGGNRKL